MFYTYILLLKNGDLYKGSTSDLKYRIQEHNQGRVKATKDYRPIKFIGYEAYCCKSDAQRRERFLKTTEGKRLLRQQYKDAINLKYGEVAEWPKAGVC